MESHEQLVLNYRFKVLVENQVISFQKVSGLSMDVEMEMLSEGGHNNSGYLTAAPTKNTKTLRLQSGVYKQANSLLDKLRPGIYLRQGIVIMMLGTNGTIQKKYAAERAFVTKWEISELDAQNGQVLIDTFEIAYTEMKRMG